MVCITKQKVYGEFNESTSEFHKCISAQADFKVFSPGGSLVRHKLQQTVADWLHDGEHSVVRDSTVAPFVARHLDVSFIPEVNSPTVA